MKNMMMISAVLMALATTAYAKENKSPEAEAINAACASDAATAKCEGEKVGTGLLKCLHAYKKSTPGYKFSSACHDAMKAGRKARKESK